MRLKDRIHRLDGAGQRTREKQLMCPLCGQSGPTAETAEGNQASFALRGEVDGHPARKCFLCGAGFVVKGANTEPIPALRWSKIEARYERQRRDDARH
jgi:hypothetical protein